jgi:hypothetical protein
VPFGQIKLYGSWLKPVSSTTRRLFQVKRIFVDIFQKSKELVRPTGTQQIII